MNPHPSRSLGLEASGLLDLPRPVQLELPTRPVAPAVALQRRGKNLIFAGSVITIVGVVLYCAVCFAGGVDTELGAILLENTIPFGRATLGVLGIGTVMWLIGSFTYLRGAMDADEDTQPEQ